MPADRNSGGRGRCAWMAEQHPVRERALITEFHVAVTLGAIIGILSGVVLFPEKALLQAAEPKGAEDGKQKEELARSAGKGAGYGNQGNYNRQFPG